MTAASATTAAARSANLSPAPAPCTARDAISAPALPAVAHAMDAAVNSGSGLARIVSFNDPRLFEVFGLA